MALMSRTWPGPLNGAVGVSALYDRGEVVVEFPI